MASCPFPASPAARGSHSSRSGQSVPQTSLGRASPGQGVSQPLVTTAPMPRGWTVQPVPAGLATTGRAPPSHCFHTYQPLPASPFHYPRCHLTSSLCYCARENWGSRAPSLKEGEGGCRVKQGGGG